MAILEFKTLEFTGKGDFVRVNFLKIFYFDLSKGELGKISEFKTRKNSIEFKGVNQNSAGKRFNFLLTRGFDSLKSSLTGNRAVYVHRNSGIPLIGSNSFGIIDRDVNIIEIRPVTGCNLNCIFCSVSEGASSKKLADFVVEKDYLVEELKKVIKAKECSDVFIHIGAQGETLLYADLADLIRDFKKIKEVKTIALSTNGVLLTKELVDELIKAGLTQFNLSINAIDKGVAKKMVGCPYDVQKVIEMAKYIAKKSELIITPVWVSGYNDKEIEKIVVLCKKLKCRAGIQNFLEYKHGRNPAKQMPFEVFYDKLKKLEKKHSVKLVMDWILVKTKKLEKPFKKGEVIEAEVVCPGRMKNEKLAVAKNRVITVTNCKKNRGKVRVRITRSKYNIFYGSCL